MLQREGYEVQHAENGSAALEKLLGSPFDLIVTDINMPLMDGYELTRRVRSTEEYRDTPVILVSTESESLDRTKGFEAGANVYIVKPTQAEDLVAHVRMLTAK
jgi:two-component system chemotaxis response regulator CheY